MTRCIAKPSMFILARACAWVAATALTGCMSYAPYRVTPGQDAAEVQAAMGAPTGRYRLDGGGERLEYARGPEGSHTYMVDLDAQGRVLGWQQVLTEANFLAIVPGQTRDEVLQQLGRPGQVRAIARQGIELWTWRYESLTCTLFVVSMEPAGRVREASHAPDPRCDDPRRDD